jgi:phenylacetate-CoA ligase
MNVVRDADKTPIDHLRPHIQACWARQAAYVAQNSGLYRDLWQGKAPPENIRDLAKLPLSDKSQLRVSQADHPPFGNYLHLAGKRRCACIAHPAPPDRP